jgi:hypothetical protein
MIWNLSADIDEKVRAWMKAKEPQVEAEHTMTSGLEATTSHEPLRLIDTNLNAPAQTA